MRYNLTISNMTRQEVEVLVAITGSVVGGTDGPRGFTDKVYYALLDRLHIESGGMTRKYLVDADGKESRLRMVSEWPDGAREQLEITVEETE